MLNFSAVWFVAPVIAYLIWFLLSQSMYNPSEMDINQLDSTIQSIKFDVYGSFKQTDQITFRHAKEINKISTKYIAIRSAVQMAAQDNTPVVLTDSDATSWASTKWDLWNLASSNKWPILSSVLSLHESHLFVVELERDLGGMIGTKSPLLTSDRPVLVPEMYFADFLFDLRNSSPVASKYFFAANYRVIESIAKVHRHPHVALHTLISNSWSTTLGGETCEWRSASQGS